VGKKNADRNEYYDFIDFTLIRFGRC